VDAVIDPSDTRASINAALDALIDKREVFRGRKHDNTPL
jgi:acetyl-CoA carboxylase carboxyltransferase component